jgi:integrase/recombinase XerD
VVRIIHKSTLPRPEEVPPALRAAAAAALTMPLREPRPAGFPLLFTSDMKLIEPAVAFLHEHSIQRAHPADTLRTCAEILLDWFNTLEQNRTIWSDADAVDLVAYRNRMLSAPSPRTQRPYSVRTIDHRVRGVLRFYEWAVRHSWLSSSELTGRDTDFTVTPRYDGARHHDRAGDRGIFLLRQFESQSGRGPRSADPAPSVGPSSVDQTHYLRGYAKQLRQKLESDPVRPQDLLTGTGIGHRLVVSESAG